jgi:hypothetical protein
MRKQPPKAEPIRLLETVLSPEIRVDRETGIVHGVKFLGRESVNGRSYSDQAMADAKRLYESVVINIDHDRKEPSRERGFMEGFAFPIPEKFEQRADGIYGSLQTIKNHPATPTFLEWAEKSPKRLGLSHNAEGKSRREGGKTIIESLSRVHSVDLVRNPATTNGLFESKEHVVKKTIREILESQFPQTFKGCGLLEEDAAMAATPVEMPEGGDSEDQIWAAFKQAILAAVDDDKLDIKATLKKVGDILKAYDKLTGAPAKESSGPPNDGAPKMESKDPIVSKLLESMERLEQREQARDKRDQARSLMAELNVAEDTAFLESLVKLPDVKSMRELCEREAKLRPRAAGKAKPFIESASSRDQPALASYPKDSKEFAAALR